MLNSSKDGSLHFPLQSIKMQNQTGPAAFAISLFLGYIGVPIFCILPNHGYLRPTEIDMYMYIKNYYLSRCSLHHKDICDAQTLDCTHLLEYHQFHQNSNNKYNYNNKTLHMLCNVIAACV